MADKRDNLITPEELNSRRSPEKHSEDSRKGGIASGKSRNLAARLREWAEDGGYELMIEKAKEEIDKGNTKMWELVRDTMGEKPSEKMDLTGAVPVIIKDDLKE